MGMTRSGVDRLSLDDLRCVTGGQIYSYPTNASITRYCYLARSGYIIYTETEPTPLEIEHLSRPSIVRCLSEEEAERSVIRDMSSFNSMLN